MAEARNGDERDPVVSLRDIKKIYQMGDVEVHALNGVDLDIWPAEMIAIMGPSRSAANPP